MLDINECSSNPCWNNGSCIDLVNGYVCECPAPWKGKLCRSGEIFLKEISVGHSFFFSQITAQRENSFCVNSISDFVFLQKVHIVTAILVEMEESAQILAMVLNVTASRDLPAEFVS